MSMDANGTPVDRLATMLASLLEICGNKRNRLCRYEPYIALFNEDRPVPGATT